MSRATRNPLVCSLLMLLLASCAADPQLADVPVAMGPLGECYERHSRGGGEGDGEQIQVSKRARLHAKALVEGSAARICGKPFSAPMMSFDGERYAAEIQWRHEKKRRKVYLTSPPSLWTWKYLLDHLGDEYELIPKEMTLEAETIIGPYMKGKRGLADTREALEDFEERLAHTTGKTTEDFAASELTVDTSMGVLGGYTLLPYLPLFDSSVIHLPRLGVRGPWTDLSTYGHELMHAIVAEESNYPGSIWMTMFHSATPSAKNFVEEAWCQVFGELVAKELETQGLLVRKPRRRPGVYKIVEARRNKDGTLSGTAKPIRRGAPGLEEQLDRLAALYHDPSLRFPSILRSQARYGYVKNSRLTERSGRRKSKPGPKVASHMAAAIAKGGGELRIDLQAVFNELVIYMNPVEIAAVIPSIRTPREAIALRDQARSKGWLERERAAAFLDSLH